MSAPVDVLAVMDEAIQSYMDEGGDPSDLRAARAAVAELIEAGVELQAAMDENETAASKFDKSSADRFHKADVRHRAALARVTGGAS